MGASIYHICGMAISLPKWCNKIVRLKKSFAPCRASRPILPTVQWFGVGVGIGVGTRWSRGNKTGVGVGVGVAQAASIPTPGHLLEFVSHLTDAVEHLHACAYTSYKSILLIYRVFFFVLNNNELWPLNW